MVYGIKLLSKYDFMMRLEYVGFRDGNGVFEEDYRDLSRIARKYGSEDVLLGKSTVNMRLNGGDKIFYFGELLFPIPDGEEPIGIRIGKTFDRINMMVPIIVRDSKNFRVLGERLEFLLDQGFAEKE
jgi:hypothetical protein